MTRKQLTHESYVTEAMGNNLFACSTIIISPDLLDAVRLFVQKSHVHTPNAGISEQCLRTVHALYTR